jgi:hypothetical protein
VAKKSAEKKPKGKKQAIKDIKPKNGKDLKGGRRAYEYDHHYGSPR